VGLAVPNYWIVTVTEENYKVIMEKHVYGAPTTARKNVRQLIRPGDIIIVYVAKKGAKTLGGRLVAAYRVKTEWREEDKLLWPDEHSEGKVLYPYRVNVEPIIECNSPQAPQLRELVPTLSFIKKKDKWQAYLVGTIANAGKPIPPQDAEKIIEELEKRCGKD